MIESGLGLALIPEMAVNSRLADSPGLRARPLAAPGPLRTIALVARRSTSRIGELKALGAVLREASGRSGAPQSAL
jgi:LysR family hydrogen peroxide-inducible transcriptional activator